MKSVFDMKKKYKRQVLMIVLIVILILSVIVVAETVIIVSKNQSSDINGPGEVLLNVVETPMVDLQYNDMSVDNLRVTYSDSEPYEVTFLADVDGKSDIVLCSFNFNGEEGTVIGTIEDKNGDEAVVRLVQNTYTESSGWTKAQVKRLNSAQTDLIDCITANMPLVESADAVAKEVLEDRCIEIETPFVKLLYPKEWEEYLEVEKVEGDPYKVKFYCQIPDKDKVELFTYTFGKSKGTKVGYLKDVRIGLITSTKDADKSWTEEEKEVFYTMREDASVIIDGLVNVKGFKLAQ